MIKITANAQDGGVMLEASLKGDSVDIGKELAAIVMQVPMELLRENPESYNEFKYRLEMSYAATAIDTDREEAS